jgi:hypothetical protein
MRPVHVTADALLSGWQECRLKPACLDKLLRLVGRKVRGWCV